MTTPQGPLTEQERKKKIKEEITRFLLEEAEAMKNPPITEQTSGRCTVGVTMVECVDKKDTDFVQANQMVDHRFKIIGKLREGGFGQIYKAYDEKTTAEVAMKLETMEANKKNLEAIVLTRFHSSEHCPKIFAKGFVRRSITYVAMQLLGKNLSELRKSCPLKPPRFTVGSGSRLIFQCVQAIEELHNIGFIHRDIKPSNFAMGCQEEDKQIVYMLDYGLSYYYLTKEGAIKSERTRTRFCGTIRYASVNAHDGKDLSRRDDLWSIFYSLYEFLNGSFPWRSPDRNLVGAMKKQHPPDRMCNKMPQTCRPFADHLIQIKFVDQPKYEMIKSQLKSLSDEYGSKANDPFDWQVEGGCVSLVHWAPP